MSTTLRAIYSNGHLVPLSPLELEEGQEVNILLTDPREEMMEILSGVMVDPNDYADYLGEIDDIPPIGAFDHEAGHGKPLSEIIIEERGQQI